MGTVVVLVVVAATVLEVVTTFAAVVFGASAVDAVEVALEPPHPAKINSAPSASPVIPSRLPDFRPASTVDSPQLAVERDEVSRAPAPSGTKSPEHVGVAGEPDDPSA